MNFADWLPAAHLLTSAFISGHFAAGARGLAAGADRGSAATAAACVRVRIANDSLSLSAVNRDYGPVCGGAARR